MKRISIVGSPGAGKTTFAKALAKKTGLPLLHLDYFYHQAQYDFYNNKEAWFKKVKELASSDKWILEGNYGSSYEYRFPRTDTLIFLDISPAVSVYGVLKRRVVYRNKKRAEMPFEWKEKIDPIFFKYVLLFRWRSRKDVVAGIEKYRHEGMEVIHFRTRREAYRWLEGLR